MTAYLQRSLRSSLLALTASALCSTRAAEPFAFTPLDDFEDVSPWVKGDPNTDLTQKDAAVVGSREIVKQGKQSLSFGYADSPIRLLADFEPMFRTLFDAYDWVWIYASSSAKTLPYRDENCRMYSETLNTALATSVRGE